MADALLLEISRKKTEIRRRHLEIHWLSTKDCNLHRRKME